MGAWVPTCCCAAVAALAVCFTPARPRGERVFWHEDPVGGAALERAYALDLIGLALAGGAPVATALETVSEASASGEARQVLARVAAAMKWGLDERQAWASAPQAWRPAATAFSLAGRAGAAPAELLHRAAADMRASETERVTIAGAKAGVRIVLPLGLCFLPAFLLITIVPLVIGLVDLN